MADMDDEEVLRRSPLGRSTLEPWIERLGGRALDDLVQRIVEHQDVLCVAISWPYPLGKRVSITLTTGDVAGELSRRITEQEFIEWHKRLWPEWPDIEASLNQRKQQLERENQMDAPLRAFAGLPARQLTYYEVRVE